MKTTMTYEPYKFTFKIEIDEINSFEALNMLVETYVEISHKFDNYIADYNLDDVKYFLSYSIDIVTPEGKVSEEKMFTLFANDPILASKAVNFIYNVINWCKDNDSCLWQDEENPLAECGAYALCMHDEKYIPLYIELLLQNDMDHEVYQGDHIDNIIEKYGFTSNVLRLMANRIGGAIGQHGEYQVEKYLPQLFELFLYKPEKKELFLNAAVQSIYQSSVSDPIWFGFYFDSVRYLGLYIFDANERAEWLEKQEQQAKQIFGETLDVSDDEAREQVLERLNKIKWPDLH